MISEDVTGGEWVLHPVGLMPLKEKGNRYKDWHTEKTVSEDRGRDWAHFHAMKC